MSLERELEQFGLDSKKARVYLAVLELGEARVIEITKKAGIERPTTYDILEKLSQEGLVSFYEKRGVRYYVAEDPGKIKRKMEEKQRKFEELMPELRSVYNTLKTKPTIKYYDGIEGIKTIIEDTLTARDKKLKGILSVVDLFEIPGKKFMDDYVARRIIEGVRLRVIRSKPKEIPEYWPTDPEALRELRYAPAEMVFSMTVYLYHNKVSFISSRKERFGIVMESEEFHDTLNHLFEALWQMSRPE